MLSLESATWGSQAVPAPAPARTGTTPDRDRERRRRRGPAMVIHRPTTAAAVEPGPPDALHPAGRVDIYL
ncbi:hypothetical protein AB2L27_03315 [Kineococcus sp. LSe6-4]|uniref:Uncharacterized protein n=1 Tax=Kineococcus halophytocola TaxID=3234027 RepID=A0ABV4GXI3_9ACTN